MPSASMPLVQAGLSASLPGRPAGVLGGPRQPPPVPPQIGIPDVEAVISAELDYKFATSGYDVRKWVASAAEGLALGPLQGAVDELTAAVAEAEKASGSSLISSKRKAS